MNDGFLLQSYDFAKDHYLPLNRPQNLCTFFGRHLNLALKPNMRSKAWGNIFFLFMVS